MRKVDKTAFINDFDKSIFFGNYINLILNPFKENTFAHEK